MRKELSEQFRNAVSIAFVKLSENGTIDEVTASEHSDMFLEWQDGINYILNNIVNYEENTYKCLQAHKSQEDWTPDVTPSLWKKIGDITEEYPEWSQPISSADAYNLGDKVTYNSKHYISIINANVWSPDVYGWQEAE